MDNAHNLLLISKLNLISPLAFHTDNVRFKQCHQSIEYLFLTIDLVRSHRAYLYKRMSGHNIEQQDYEAIQQGLLTLSKQATKHPPLGSLAQRRLLSAQLKALTLGNKGKSLTKHLIEHGQILRTLLFHCDDALMKSLNGRINGNYNEYWQTIMSAVDALTQYRLAMLIEPAQFTQVNQLLISRGNQLLSKIQRLRKCRLSQNTQLQEVSEHLVLTLKALGKSEAVSPCVLYLDTQLISQEIHSLYYCMIEETLETYAEQLNRLPFSA